MAGGQAEVTEQVSSVRASVGCNHPTNFIGSGLVQKRNGAAEYNANAGLRARKTQTYKKERLLKNTTTDFDASVLLYTSSVHCQQVLFCVVGDGIITVVAKND